MKFTSAATHNSFMLVPMMYAKNEIVAMDCTYVNYAKFEDFTEREVVYITKMLLKTAEPPPEETYN